MINTNHKWHGDCEVLSVDGKYLTIRFLNGETIQVKRVQARMMNVQEPMLVPTKRNATIITKPHLACLCKRAEKIKQFGKCLHCHINALRKWATDIERLKNETGACLSETNKAKWDTMNSQQQKIAVFRAMELGFIQWKVSGKSN